MFQICHYPYGSYRAWFKRSPGRGCRLPEVACFGCRLIVFRLKILFRVWPRGKHLSTSAKNFFPMLVLTLSLNGELNQRMLRSRFLLWPVLGGKGGGGGKFQPVIVVTLIQNFLVGWCFTVEGSFIRPKWTIGKCHS